MAVTPDEGVVDGDCESWELKNLFLADASVFPTSLGEICFFLCVLRDIFIIDVSLLYCSGINPMITVEAISYMTSKVIMERLNVIFYANIPIF
jgi:hypothetical protein